MMPKSLWQTPEWVLQISVSFSRFYADNDDAVPTA